VKFTRTVEGAGVTLCPRHAIGIAAKSVLDRESATAIRGVTMAKTDRHRKSPRHGKFVSITMFRALESEVLQMRDTMEAVRHESSDNLRRCGELQFELDTLKKASEILVQ
jgi:hypothetical protein